VILKRKIPIFEILAAKELVQLLPNSEPTALVVGVMQQAIVTIKPTTLVVGVFKGLLITTST